jgi:ribonuclease PH
MLPSTCAWLRLVESCWFQSSLSLARVATMLLFKWRSSIRLSQVASTSIMCVSKEELTECINKLKQEHDSAQNVTVNYKMLYDAKWEEFIELEKQLE